MEIDMTQTMTMTLCSVLAAAFLVPTLASAQAGDVAYCAALVKKYDQYLNKDSRQGIQPQSLDSRNAAEKCKAGDASGIAPLEKALKDAKIDLPPRS
jgi:hypothetical protein